MFFKKIYYFYVLLKKSTQYSNFQCHHFNTTLIITDDTMSLYSSQSLPTTPHLIATDTTYMSPKNEQLCTNNNIEEDKQTKHFNTINSRFFVR